MAINMKKRALAPPFHIHVCQICLWNPCVQDIVMQILIELFERPRDYMELHAPETVQCPLWHISHISQLAPVDSLHKTDFRRHCRTGFVLGPLARVESFRIYYFLVQFNFGSTVETWKCSISHLCGLMSPHAVGTLNVVEWLFEFQVGPRVDRKNIGTVWHYSRLDTRMYMSQAQHGTVQSSYQKQLPGNVMNLIFGLCQGQPPLKLLWALVPVEGFRGTLAPPTLQRSCDHNNQATVALDVTCFEIENYFGNCSCSETLDTLHNRPVPQPQHTPGHRLPHPSSSVIPFSRDKHSTANMQMQAELLSSSSQLGFEFMPAVIIDGLKGKITSALCGAVRLGKFFALICENHSGILSVEPKPLPTRVWRKIWIRKCFREQTQH
jgi:hypothetical protein